MQDYEHIRRMYLVDGLSQRQIAQKLGISRNTVAKYCEGNTYPGLRASYCRAAHCRQIARQTSRSVRSPRIRPGRCHADRLRRSRHLLGRRTHESADVLRPPCLQLRSVHRVLSQAEHRGLPRRTHTGLELFRRRNAPRTLRQCACRRRRWQAT